MNIIKKFGAGGMIVAFLQVGSFPANADEVNKELPDISTNSNNSCGGVPMEDLKKKLTPLQYEVTQNAATERPFQNEYWDNKKAGIYVDIISGEPLFSSKDKFDSGSGWPSFTKPLSEKAVVAKSDTTYGMSRTEIRTAKSDSHLGHVFDDGPGPDGKRYCMNSASLRFIPVEKLEEEGYGEWKKLFE